MCAMTVTIIGGHLMVTAVYRTSDSLRNLGTNSMVNLAKLSDRTSQFITHSIRGHNY